MLKIVVKIFLMFAIVVSVNMLIRKFIYDPLKLFPYSYASDEIHFKKMFFTAHKKKFNTIFIGSSHVFRQFDGHLFDTIACSKNYLSSFNFGVKGLAASELFYLNDHILEEYYSEPEIQDSLPLKYLLIELSKITFPDHLNLNTTRMYYWYDWNYFVFTIKAITESRNYNFFLKIAVSVMTIGFLDKQLNFSYFSDLNNYVARDKHLQEVMKGIKKNYNGYDPRPKTLGELLNDTNVLTIRKNASAEQFQKFETNPDLLKKYNKAYLSKINETIERFSHFGIHVVFVFGPRADKQQYDEIIPLLNRIDKKNKIEIADSRKYPELYYLENSADETHLNTKGAEVFTTLLSQKFKEFTKSSGN